jgi:hypothetical protein
MATKRKPTKPKVEVKDVQERIADALEEIAQNLRFVVQNIEENTETLELFRRETWSLEKAIRGEPREDE